ncbi:MAG: RNA-binding transcriptional accessory protein [Proteobacteria bacterium]|nr:RNA-binding transcriptional accessory protein [Desulfobacula sp.]MBU3951968.1 RNA-binding transcriptional accessory protein [Pseudomonadota bacterium]MBU4130493.1 RNA-binding transcriptional accessory protein [Pseudomonadota bacterium]
MNIILRISRELGLKEKQVDAVASLLDQGATIPFIARYRKEMTGSLDEVVIADIRDRVQTLKDLSARKEAILKSLTERQLLTPDLADAIGLAASMTALEDLYERYRPKKRTRAQAAREKGLDPLAAFILAQQQQGLMAEAQKYICPDKEVTCVEEALAGARDIIAETINEDPKARVAIRDLFGSSAMISSQVKKDKAEEASKFRDYFDWSEPAFKTPSHRVLAMLRGKNESILTVHVLVEEASAIALLDRFFLRHPSKTNSDIQDQVRLSIRDAYKRLLSKSIEKESLDQLKRVADDQAIAVFVTNLRELLLSPPLGQKRVMAIDPGFRTGCKVVCLDSQGKLLHHDVIFPHDKGRGKAGQTISDLAKKYSIEALAIGNGTAGRETQVFIKEMDLPKGIEVVMVDESGASIYSASDIARQEFPDHDITVRGAVSIGRRLMDPLAELVKIDPKSIGVGQYQHDVDQKLLRNALEDVVKSCVNQVGVEANTASRELLAQVSGLNPSIAANMVAHRNENGPFTNRKQFLKVPRLGPKAFEQAAGFLRIQNGKNPLDKSGIHPESYDIVARMALQEGCKIEELLHDAQRVRALDLTRFITPAAGLPTLTDIVNELAAPGRDPRKSFQSFSFDETIHKITDLVPGMRVPGIVTNVTAFGAFVDIGVHQDGLVHISQLADQYVREPSEVVSVRQQVWVKVLEVDVNRRRISLSMKQSKD